MRREDEPLKVQLDYSKEWDRWVLRDRTEPVDADHHSYEMVIECGWDGEKWYRYKFIEWNDGDWYEVVDIDQYKALYDAVEEHEGQEMAELWAEHQSTYNIRQKHHRVFRLQRHWEAMMDLNLFAVPVTWKRWEGKRFSDEGQAAMDQLRDRQIREAVAEKEKEAERQAGQCCPYHKTGGDRSLSCGGDEAKGIEDAV